jgi:hypothetical protein
VIIYHCPLLRSRNRKIAYAQLPKEARQGDQEHRQAEGDHHGKRRQSAGECLGRDGDRERRRDDARQTDAQSL